MCRIRWPFHFDLIRPKGYSLFLKPFSFSLLNHFYLNHYEITIRISAFSEKLWNFLLRGSKAMSTFSLQSCAEGTCVLLAFVQPSSGSSADFDNLSSWLSRNPANTHVASSAPQANSGRRNFIPVAKSDDRAQLLPTLTLKFTRNERDEGKRNRQVTSTNVLLMKGN